MADNLNKNTSVPSPAAGSTSVVRLQNIKYAPPPPQLPVIGKVEPAQISFIGQTNYVAALEEKKFVFGIKREDRRRHLYIIGKSGAGKSKLIELLIRQDIASGNGVCLMDPHGDLITEILDFIPEHRKQDVCIIDPTQLSSPVAFNPLAHVEKVFRHRLTQGLVRVMEKQFGTSWTPRVEHLFRFTALALLDYPQATMHGMISMLTDATYRQRVIQHSTDAMVRRFWEVEFIDWSTKFDGEAIIPLLNKLNQLLLDPLLRGMFHEVENKIDFERLMNERKIVLVNLAKGKLGEENSSFFGSLLLMKIKQAGAMRSHLPEKSRPDFYLYLDGLHQLVIEAFESLFSEGRKYGVCLTIANQYLDQLVSRAQASLLGNIGSLIVFRVGGQDAEKLESEMAPVFKVKDMINLGKQEFYIKLMIDGESYDPFSARTLKVLKPDHISYREQIIEESRRQYTISTPSQASSA